MPAASHAAVHTGRMARAARTFCARPKGEGKAIGAYIYLRFQEVREVSSTGRGGRKDGGLRGLELGEMVICGASIALEIVFEYVGI